MVTVDAGAPLNQFRQTELSGSALLAKLAAAGGKMLVTLPVGVGKSVGLDNTVEAAVASGQYDLIVVLSPTRRTLNERRWVKQKPDGIDVRVLKPRPARRCGSLDDQWRRFERMGLTVLGRSSLCCTCPRRQNCFWPDQYGKALKGTEVIFTTQAQVGRDPAFIDSLATWAGAEKVLVLLDENDMILTSYERRITIADLKQFKELLERIPVGGEKWASSHAQWIYQVDCLLGAEQKDLFASSWQVPAVRPDWAYHVQKLGYELYGDEFRFLGHELSVFCRSAPATRERPKGQGFIRFTQKPLIDSDVIVFSAGCDPSFTRFRLGLDLADPFGAYSFKHPGTRWFNISSWLGSRRNFPRNHEQILDFFTQLVALRHAEGKRCLLVSKKKYLATCARKLQRHFRAMGLPLNVVWKNWTPRRLADKNAVALISYGMIGTNLFEDFDAAYCLNSYYVNEDVLGTTLHDLSRSDCRIPVKISVRRTPHRRRHAHVLNPADRYYEIAKVADVALRHMELDAVLQAVGRVRPYTREREIILFQCGEHPAVPYDAEFDSLAEARRHFGIATARSRKADGRKQLIAAARVAGLTQKQTAERLGCTERTVQRAWK